MKYITDKLTGLVYDVETQDQLVESMELIKKQIKALKDAEAQIRDLMLDIDWNGYENQGRTVRISHVQRMEYDKATLRALLDEDVFDVLTKVDKTAVDKYIRDNLEDLGDVASQLRDSMMPCGKPYAVVKLEKTVNTNN